MRIESTIRLRKTALAVLCVGGLYACGGGGSGSSVGGQPSSPTLAVPVILEDGTNVGAPTFTTGVSATGGQGQIIQGLACTKPLQSSQTYANTHLNLVVDGQAVAIPQNIGFVSQGNAGITDPALRSAGCTYPVVTTDTSGKIRFRSGSTANYTLGQLFALWGQPLGSSNVAGFSGKLVKVFLKDGTNLAEYTGDLQALPLTPDREITIQVGTASAQIPNYQWNNPPPLSTSPIQVVAGAFGAQFNGQLGLEGNKTSGKGGQGQSVGGVSCYGPLNQTTSTEAYHTHSHLAIYRDGVRLAIPQLIGIVGDDNVPSSTCFYPLHTHDTTGTLHVETDNLERFTLGQFFDIWGQPLTRSNVAGQPSSAVVVYVNDGGNVRKYQGDVRDIELRSYRSIVIQLGAPLSEIPSFTQVNEKQ